MMRKENLIKNLEKAKDIAGLAEIRRKVRQIQIPTDFKEVANELADRIVRGVPLISRIPGAKESVKGTVAGVIPSATALNEVGKIRRKLDEIVDAILQLTITFIFSSLEDYMKSLIGDEKAYKLINTWAEDKGKSEEITKKIHELRILRNVIMHSDGEVDLKARDEFKRYRIDGYNLGNQIQINIEKIEEFIEDVENFIE